MNESTTELDWQAFRYVAGEMTPAELSEFESALAEDQLARDAVVRAVELSQCVALAEAVHPTELVAPVGVAPFTRYARSGDWSQAFTWFTSGVAACLCLMWSSQFIASSHSAVSAELAEAWGTQLETMDGATVTATEEPLPETLETETIFIGETDHTWMVEAVRILEKTSDNDDAAAETMES